MGGKYRLRQPPVAEPGQNQWLYWFQWVPIHDIFPQKTTSVAGGAVRGKVDSMARFPRESGKEKTSVCTGFANMPLACWI